MIPMNRVFPVALLSVITQAALASTQATLDPPVVAPGSPAVLRIVTDTGAEPTGLDRITGADVYSAGRSSQISIFNGAVTQQATYSYQIVPHAEGTLNLGPFQVGPDQTDSLTLTVDASAAPSSRRGRAGRAPTPPPQRSPAASQTVPAGDRAFLRLWLGDDSPYVGQSVPLTVSAYLREDVGGTLQGAPQLTAQDFVLDGMEEDPTRKQVDVNGQTYTRFTWTASLTPVREGAYPLSAELPATLQWVEQVQSRRRGSMLDEMLANDPFFRNSGFSRMLGGMGGFDEPQVRTNEVVLKANRGEIEVLPPPLEGRPDRFTGAVGQFELSLGEVAQQATVGEPIELHWTVEGSGNISGLSMPGLPDGEGYRTYPPESRFEPAVRSGTKGVKHFTQLVVPRQAGTLELPPVALSYLDPTTDTYEEVQVDLPPVEISGAAVPTSNSTLEGEAAGPADAPIDGPRSLSLPPTARHGIIALVPLAWLLVLGAWLLRNPLSTRLGSLWAALTAAWVRRSLRRQMRTGVQTADEERFFRAGLALVERHPTPHGEGVRVFLDEADRALYARVQHDPETLDALYRQLLHDLNEKEAA